MSFKTMLSPNEDPMKNPLFFEQLRYPLLCSPKLDGIRCLTAEGVCKSRTFLDIPNLEIQELFSKYQGFDGELIVGEPTDVDVYNRTQSTVMSINKPAIDIRYYIFDDIMVPPTLPFELRLDAAKEHLNIYKTFDNITNIFHLGHVLCKNAEEVIAYENECLADGYEGIMMRDPQGKYKYGRGTFKEGLIYKLKRFTDDEGLIIGFIEQTENTNIAGVDAFGRSKRSTAKEGLLPAGTLGKFVINYSDELLEVGCGSFNHKERQEIWDNQEIFKGLYLKFRHFAHGVKDKPRFPRAVGLRDPMDL